MERFHYYVDLCILVLLVYIQPRISSIKEQSVIPRIIYLYMQTSLSYDLSFDVVSGAKADTKLVISNNNSETIDFCIVME